MNIKRLTYLLTAFTLVLMLTSFSTRNQSLTHLNSSSDPPAISHSQPLRVGVIGLVHTHVHWILGRPDRGDIEIVGIVEPNRALAETYSRQHGYSMDLVYDTIEEMVEAQHPEAVTAFNTIYGHLEVVAYCAPRGIHVMVEKPLAVNLAHAREMVKLAREHGIHLLTNYETSWYGSVGETRRQVHGEKSIGNIRRIVFQTGHPGPIEIGCNEEFLEWLTDPVLNGGGALTDFGCYGANIATWMLKGSTPLTVSCITQQIKPDKYPKVEDEATIVLTYPKTHVLIQASWNWSHNRKDMTVYGVTGFVESLGGQKMRIQKTEQEGPQSFTAPPLPAHVDDPFAYLFQVVNNKIDVEHFGLSSLENNLIVMQILEAAKESAATHQTIVWEDFFASKDR